MRTMSAALSALLLVDGASAGPWACDAGQPAVVGGVTYKTRVALVQEGFPAAPRNIA